MALCIDNFGLHRITDMVLTDIQHHQSDDETKPEFWCRNICITNDDGVQQIALFTHQGPEALQFHL